MELTINKDCTPEQFDHYCNRLTQAGKAMRFALGDTVALAQSKKWLGREAFRKLQTSSGYSVRSLQNFAQVARAFPLGARTEELGFSHFAAVVALPEKERQPLLKEAGEKGLSVRDLRKRLRQDNGPLPSDRIREAVTLYVVNNYARINRARQHYLRELRQPFDPEWLDQYYKTDFREYDHEENNRWDDELIRFFFHDPLEYAMQSITFTESYTNSLFDEHERYGLRNDGDDSGLNEVERHDFLMYTASRYGMLENALIEKHANPKTHTMVEAMSEALERRLQFTIQEAQQEIEYMLP